jgi:hypothetical protein
MLPDKLPAADRDERTFWCIRHRGAPAVTHNGHHWLCFKCSMRDIHRARSRYQRAITTMTKHTTEA